MFVSLQLVLGIDPTVGFGCAAEAFLKVCLVLLSPLVPAIMLLERGRVARQNLLVQKKLFERIELLVDHGEETHSYRDLEKDMIGR